MTIGRSHTEEHVCSVCKGTGQDTEEGILSDEDCPVCKGKGYIVINTQQVDGETLRVLEEDD